MPALRYLDINTNRVQTPHTHSHSQITTRRTTNRIGIASHCFQLNATFPDGPYGWAATSLEYLDLSFNQVHIVCSTFAVDRAPTLL